jgi:hypothetical protein
MRVLPLGLLFFLCGCGSKSMPDAQAWLIESWEDPVLTVKHGGNTYKATCLESITLHPDGKDPETSPHCFLAINQVGHTIQPLDGRKQDADGRIVVIFQISAELALRSYNGKDTQAPWFQEDYKITSVTKDQDSN